MRTAIQLYTLRDRTEPTLGTLSRVSETTFDGVEFAGVPEPGTSIGLETTGLAAAGAHVDVATLEEEFETVVDACDRIDCDHVVVPSLGEDALGSPEAIARSGDRLGRLAARLADHGVTLHYHNHDHEFVEVAGHTAFERLVTEVPASVEFEVDLGWALAAGVDPVALLDGLAGRVSLVHVKDVDAATRTPVELGEGDLDLTACAAAAHRADVEWLVYEHDDPADPLASLEHGADVLAELRDVGGRNATESGRSEPTTAPGGQGDTGAATQDRHGATAAGRDADGGSDEPDDGSGGAWWDDAAK